MEKKKKRKKWKNVLVVIGLAFSLSAGWFTGAIMMEVHKRPEIEWRDLENRKLEMERDSIQARMDSLHVLSWENIEYWVDTLGIEHPEVVIQQIALETGMLTSAICQENHNLFGMKQARVRETTALGTKRGHAYYSDYIESIKDYKLWQDSMYDGGDYYAFLNRIGYAEARHYTATLKMI